MPVAGYTSTAESDDKHRRSNSVIADSRFLWTSSTDFVVIPAVRVTEVKQPAVKNLSKKRKTAVKRSKRRCGGGGGGGGAIKRWRSYMPRWTTRKKSVYKTRASFFQTVLKRVVIYPTPLSNMVTAFYRGGWKSYRRRYACWC
ncbi:hypothetical protein R1flu_001111 [Riccia fluitans]|uniref:Uncharacterized protein n=1 Tax=Riccia fluitans TaxID=41844 RepID=A0ABD1Y2C0_9MARC